jgi:glycosyltransferase involved in cell wall biosynthesis
MLELGLLRYLPAAARPSLIRNIDRLHTFQRAPFRLLRYEERPFQGRRVAVAGFFQMPTGLGRSATLILHTLRAEGCQVYAIDLTSALKLVPSLSPENIYTPADFASLQATDLVIHVNPPLFLKALKAFPFSALEKATVVGVWFWESEIIPKFWYRSARCCDQIWGVSPFVVDAIRRDAGPLRNRVTLRPYAIDADPFPLINPKQREAARAKYGISLKQFVAGYSFSMASNYERKNPMAAVAAFQIAFRGTPDARLILRCQDMDAYPSGKTEMQNVAKSDSRIMLIHSRSLPLHEFYSCIDVYLALFRSEGYGLNILEAAQSGLPSIATEWSLSPDIIRLSSVRTTKYSLISVREKQGQYEGLGARWADPDVHHAAQHLRDVAGSGPM